MVILVLSAVTMLVRSDGSSFAPVAPGGLQRRASDLPSVLFDERADHAGPSGSVGHTAGVELTWLDEPTVDALRAALRTVASACRSEIPEQQLQPGV
jgi:hypothetical protein